MHTVVLGNINISSLEKILIIWEYNC